MFDIQANHKPKDPKDPKHAKDQPKSSRCCDCHFIFTPRSYRYYCCDRQQLACSNCKNNICNRCRFPRDRRFNFICHKCTNTFNEDDTFFDFKQDRYYCSRCLAKKYIYHYQQMVMGGREPVTEMVKINSSSEYGIEELINFFRKRCFCCIEVFKEGGAFEMMHGARICSNCLEVNIDRVLPKLIMCVQCNGYLHDRTEIKFEITHTEVICIHCATDEVKLYDALQRKSVAESVKGSKFSSKVRSQTSESVVSVEQLSRVRESGLKGEQPRMVKVISKLSIEEESKNVPLGVTVKSCPQPCAKCNSFFSPNSMFRLQLDEVKRLQLEQEKKEPWICHECFTHYNKYMNKSEKKEIIIKQYKTQKNLEGEQVSQPLPSFQSLQELNDKTKPKLDNGTLSPRVRSPNRIFKKEDLPSDLFCEVCKKAYGSIRTARGLECITCARLFPKK